MRDCEQRSRAALADLLSVRVIDIAAIRRTLREFHLPVTIDILQMEMDGKGEYWGRLFRSRIRTNHWSLWR